MSTARKLLLGSVFRNADLVLSIAAAFVMTPFIVHALGSRAYGFWILILAFMGYYNLMNYGIYAAAARYAAQAIGKDDRAEVNRVANTGFLLLALIGAATLAFTAAAAAASPWFIRDPGEAALFRRVLLILGGATAASFPLNMFTGILTANVRFDASAAISITKTLLVSAGAWAALSHGHGIAALAAITAAGNLFQNLASYAACRAQLPYLRVLPPRWDGARAREMFDYAWKILVSQVGDVLRFQIDSLVIAAFLNATLLTGFSIGVRLVDGFTSLVMSSVGMMVPVFSQYEGRGDYDAMRSALLKVTKATTLLTVFVGYSILFYGRPFILAWMGPGFESSYLVTVILCVALLVELPQAPGVQLLYGLSKHESYAYLNVGGALLNVALSLLFVRRFGMYGVALGTACEVVLVKAFVQPGMICRAVDLPRRAYLGSAILAPALKAAVPLGLYFWAIRGFVRPDYLNLTGCVALQTVLFAPAAYLLILDREERALARRLLGAGGRG